MNILADYLMLKCRLTGQKLGRIDENQKRLDGELAKELSDSEKGWIELSYKLELDRPNIKPEFCSWDADNTI